MIQSLMYKYFCPLVINSLFDFMNICIVNMFCILKKLFIFSIAAGWAGPRSVKLGLTEERASQYDCCASWPWPEKWVPYIPANVYGGNRP
jgi:hypothetical protein